MMNYEQWLSRLNTRVSEKIGVTVSSPDGYLSAFETGEDIEELAQKISEKWFQDNIET